LREIWVVIGATNRYIVVREPWKLAKTDQQRAELETVLYVSADALRIVAELLRPFMPHASERVLRMLGLEAGPQSWISLSAGELRPGTKLGETSALFPRIEQSVEELRQMALDAPAPGTPAPAPSTPAPAPAPSTSAPARISIDDFMKVELRVAKVLSAERVP